MTIQELINELNKAKNKNKKIMIYTDDNEYTDIIIDTEGYFKGESFCIIYCD